MKRLPCFLWCVLIAVSASAWDMGEPLVTYWAGPGYPGHPEKLTERAAKQFKEAGFNTVWATSVEELDIAAKYGLRVFYDMGIDGRHFRMSDTKRLNEIGREIDRVKDHPALFFYRHCDEPWEGLFGELARMKEWMHERDPKHPAWVNLLPIYANNEQLGVDGEISAAYREHVRRFIETYRPEFTSYDHYQFNGNHDTANYLFNLSIVREAAAAAGIPFVNGVQACTWVPGEAASPGSPRIPGVDELRFLVYTTLAYGAQGIYYYVYSCQGHRGAIAELDGTTGDKYEALKGLNPAFVAFAKELRPFKFAGAYLQGVQAKGATPYCEAAQLKLSPAAPNRPIGQDGLFTDTTLVSRFDKDGRAALFMVVNMDYHTARTVTVTAPGPLERFSPVTHAWVPANGNSMELKLKRGGGALLRLAH